MVLEEIRRRERGALIRYDDAHGRFHRHVPGWPEPAATIAAFLDVSLRQRARYADGEIRARYTVWEAEVFGEEGDERQ